MRHQNDRENKEEKRERAEEGLSASVQREERGVSETKAPKGSELREEAEAPRTGAAPQGEAKSVPNTEAPQADTAQQGEAKSAPDTEASQGADAQTEAGEQASEAAHGKHRGRSQRKAAHREKPKGAREPFSLPGFIVKNAKLIQKFFIVACILSVMMIPLVHINYDLTEYLPLSTKSKQGIELMKEKFGYPGTGRVMIDDVSLYEAKAIKDKIEAVPNVDMVMWLDTATDVFESSDFIDYDEIKDYYKDNKAVMDITFVYGDADKETSKALDQIQEIVGEKGHIVGSAMQNKFLQKVLQQQMALILSFAVIVIFGILLLTTNAWIEPVLFLSVMGVAILINKGSDIFLGTISFMTNNVVAVLQLAVSMDYSIFLLDAYRRYKEMGKDTQTALTSAVDEALKSILASSLTTIVGFIVLAFMKFSIGFDLGLSLAKGVVWSLASVLLFMPSMILYLDKLLTKTAHRSFLPSFHRTAHGIYSLRIPALTLIVVLALPLFVGQGMNNFTYGNSAVGMSPGTQVYDDDQAITKEFGRSNMMMAIVPATSNVTEKALSDEIEDLPYVKSVQSLSNTLPAGVPEDFLPESVTSILHKNGYSRILLYTRTKDESEAAFEASDEIQSIITKYYPEGSYLVGETPATQDIKTTITNDYSFVNMLSLIGVFLVVMFSFKSIAIPVAAMIPIEIATWMNMTMPYLKGEELTYLGYIIVGCIQLGATVDYSVLITSNYLAGRNQMGLDRHRAALFTLQRSLPSLLTSGSILTVCGYLVYVVSSVTAIAQLGHLVGRGAWMSLLCVLFLLPALLSLADPLIKVNEITRIKRFLAKRKEKHKQRIQKAVSAVKGTGITQSAETNTENQTNKQADKQIGQNKNGTMSADMQLGTAAMPEAAGKSGTADSQTNRKASGESGAKLCQRAQAGGQDEKNQSEANETR